MAPPVKRQKRLAVLTSDDERSDAKSTCKPSRTRSPAKAAKSHAGGSIAVTQQASRILPKDRVAKPNRAGKAQTTRPISLFFRAGTPAQQPNDPRPCRAETPGREDHEDLIVDDSPTEDVDDLWGPSADSGLQGRTKQPPWASDNAGAMSRPNLHDSRQRFKIPECASSTDIPSGTSGVANAKSRATDLRPWAEMHGPDNLGELMVHKKKVSDVRSWLDTALRGHGCKRLLILKGPSGAGKTATITMLAKAMDVDVSEWRNPVGSGFSAESYVSITAHFEEFLGRSRMFNRLTLADTDGRALATPSGTMDGRRERTRDRIILIEEFPSTCLSTSTTLPSFRSSVLQYLAFSAQSMGAGPTKDQGDYMRVTPAVMIITETRMATPSAGSDIFTAHRLLGPELLGHPCVSVIEFNPVASTYLIKALELVVQKEARQSGRRRAPGPAVLRKLGEVGDIRSAIGSLEFLCLRGEGEDDWGGRVGWRAKKGAALTKLEKSSLEVVTQRESTVGLFHGVAKVVYNKRDDVADGESPTPPPHHLFRHVRPRIAQVSADQLIDETGTDAETFIAALHENFVLSCEGHSFADNLDGCMEVLSDSDVLGSSRGGRSGSSGGRGNRILQGALSDISRQDEICFHVAVRGLLFALPDPVKRRTHPMPRESGGQKDTYKMFYPASLRLYGKMEKIDGLVGQWHDRLRASGVTSRRALGKDGPQSTHLPSIREARPSKLNAERCSRPEDGGPEPFRTSLGCTRTELTVDRLPYLAKIERRSAGSTLLHELETITQFNRITPPGDHVFEYEDDGEGAPGRAWKTDGPAEGNPIGSVPRAIRQQTVGQAREAASTLMLPADEQVGQLYLSDDDIEDD